MSEIEHQGTVAMTATNQISRELLGKIVDEVFDGAIEDASVIEEIYAAIKKHETPAPQDHLRGWRPIAEADRSIATVQSFPDVSVTLRNSYPIWVRDEDGRTYEAVWTEGHANYWWDLEGESPVDPVEFMPHPLDPKFAAQASTVNVHVLVKPLAWTVEGADLKATVATGDWLVMKEGGRWTVFRNLQGLSHHTDEDDAKAAAQKNHESLVLSCLSIKGKQVSVEYAFCCPGSVKYCDCVNKNHGTAVMGENEAGDDYPIIGPSLTPNSRWSQSLLDVASERSRQIDAEGWNPAHDDAHADFSLAKAACIYVVGATLDGPDRAVMDTHGSAGTPGWMKELWPWDIKWWKPTDRRRDLVKAAALILAEIERLDRAAITEAKQ